MREQEINETVEVFVAKRVKLQAQLFAELAESGQIESRPLRCIRERLRRLQELRGLGEFLVL